MKRIAFVLDVVLLASLPRLYGRSRLLSVHKPFVRFIGYTNRTVHLCKDKRQEEIRGDKACSIINEVMVRTVAGLELRSPRCCVALIRGR